MANRPGRPPLDPTDRSVVVSFVLPSRAFERICRRAHVEQLSVSEIIRRVLTPTSHKIKETSGE